MKVCDKTCIFCFFPIINKYLFMAKRSLLSRCPSYFQVSGTEFHINREINVESTNRNKFISINMAFTVPIFTKLLAT